MIHLRRDAAIVQMLGSARCSISRMNKLGRNIGAATSARLRSGADSFWPREFRRNRRSHGFKLGHGNGRYQSWLRD